MNGLRDMIYGGDQSPVGENDYSLIGAQFGFNVGSETFRIQLAITGLLIAAVAFIVLLHARGHRFSVHT